LCQEIDAPTKTKTTAALIVVNELDGGDAAEYLAPRSEPGPPPLEDNVSRHRNKYSQGRRECRFLADFLERSIALFAAYKLRKLSARGIEQEELIAFFFEGCGGSEHSENDTL
jgi:hypothetical protein